MVATSSLISESFSISSMKSKYVSSWGFQGKDHTKANATKVGVLDSSILRTAIRTISFKPMMMLEHKNKRPDMDADIGLGGMVKEGFVFRQNFNIRSYEIGPGRKASIETIMNHLQETSINHMKAIGHLGDGFASTPEMCKKNLIWVVGKMQVVVDRYPIWGDVVQIDTWKAESGKNGLCGNWMFRDCKTGEILIRASCFWMMMNKETRRLSKFIDEARAELKQYLVDTPPIVDRETIKWSNRDHNIVDHVRHGLTPRWSDLDINQHVNNVKYIGWILESVPNTIMENYELATMALEYHRECNLDTILQSHTFVIGTDNGRITNNYHVECEHLLQLEIEGGGNEIMKGRTRWRLKNGENKSGH